MAEHKEHKEHNDDRHPRGGMYLDDFVVGHLYEHRLRRYGHADGQHAVLQHDA